MRPSDRFWSRAWTPQFNQAAINGFEDYVDARLHLRKGPAADENERQVPRRTARAARRSGRDADEPPERGPIGIYVAANGSQSAPVEFGVTGASYPEGRTSPRSRSAR